MALVVVSVRRPGEVCGLDNQCLPFHPADRMAVIEALSGRGMFPAIHPDRTEPRRIIEMHDQCVGTLVKASPVTLCQRSTQARRLAGPFRRDRLVAAAS